MLELIGPLPLLLLFRRSRRSGGNFFSPFLSEGFIFLAPRKSKVRSCPPPSLRPLGLVLDKYLRVSSRGVIFVDLGLLCELFCTASGIDIGFIFVVSCSSFLSPLDLGLLVVLLG